MINKSLIEMFPEEKLKSAESALVFVQAEHKRVLGGLHQEVQRLQQKCSGTGLCQNDTRCRAQVSSKLIFGPLVVLSVVINDG